MIEENPEGKESPYELNEPTGTVPISYIDTYVSEEEVANIKLEPTTTKLATEHPPKERYFNCTECDCRAPTETVYKGILKSVNFTQSGEETFADMKWCMKEKDLIVTNVNQVFVSMLP